jgi:repressor LexA
MLTKRQRQVLAFLENEVQQTGVMPSTREIQQHFGFSSQTAAVNHLRALERKGAIQRAEGKARGVALSSALRRGRIIDVPIFGQIPAGMATVADQESDGTVSIDFASAGVSKTGAASDRVFALRVRGDSMTGAHILDGDIVILEFRTPREGDIVAALIDGETTLKRYVVKNGRPFLKAENPAYSDLVPVRELVIQGVLAALVRRPKSARQAQRTGGVPPLRPRRS